MNFDTDGYQAIKKTLVNVLSREHQEGKQGVTSGFIICPLSCGTEASVRVVFSNMYLPMGTQLDTSNQWLEWYQVTLEEAELPIITQLHYGTARHIAGEDVYVMPYLQITTVIPMTIQKRKYSLV